MTDQANAKPRVLFYLPVVTPWWFTNIIAPFIRAANRGGEVHVLVPPMWGCTGIGVDELVECSDIEGVNWHILDRGDHPDLRFTGPHQHIIDLVREIDPHVSLCRSADLETPKHFPGAMRYIMEGATPPFGTPSYSTQLAEGLFDHAIMPELDPALEQWLDDAMAAHWEAQKAKGPQMDREEFLAHSGLPGDKLLIGMPLEYEHEEIYWDQHYVFANNVELVDALADVLDDNTILAVTQHPLNEGSRPGRDLEEAIKRHGGKVRLVPQFDKGGQATNQMIKHCDGTIVCNSKSFAMAAFHGRPVLRISRFATGEWVKAYSTLPPFLDAIRAGTAQTANEADMRRWVGFHHANNVVNPRIPEFDVHCLVDRATQVINTARWREGLARFLYTDVENVPPLPVLDEEIELPMAVGM